MTPNATEPGTAAQPKPSKPARRWALPAEFNPFTASYRDKSIEAAYQQHLVDNVLARDRFISYLWVLIYFSFGVLDILVLGEHREEALTVRWLICTPIALAIVASSHIERFKPWFGHIYTLGVFMFAMSLVWMISFLPPDNPPPYVVGIIVVFIFAACVLHLPFLSVLAAFSITAALYVTITASLPDYNRVDLISGHFFIISSTLLAVLTNYVQEIRARTLWRQSVQREQDAEMIRQLLIEATAADRSKINFLSMMSHELRTPLHQIIGYAEIAKTTFMGANDDAQTSGEEPHDQILSSAHILLKRIQKMLRYADATAGKIEYDITPTEIGEIVEASLEQSLKGIERKGLRVNTDALEDAKIQVDIFHTCYAVNNLLENACQASSENSELHIRGAHNSEGEYELVIEDHGCGMSDEELASALKPFAQQNESVLDRHHEGLGLGLALAQKILSDQKASLSLESEIGKGTTARIKFAKMQTDAAAAND